jgi:hypothetical protein
VKQLTGPPTNSNVYSEFEISYPADAKRYGAYI